jgi:hypothetical protein
MFRVHKANIYNSRRRFLEHKTVKFYVRLLDNSKLYEVLASYNPCRSWAMLHGYSYYSSLKGIPRLILRNHASPRRVHEHQPNFASTGHLRT